MTLGFRYATPFFRQHAKSLERAAVIQGTCLICTYDVREHDPHCMVLLATVAYWIVVLMIMVRREDRMTKLDLFWMNWGFLLAVPVVALMVNTALRLHR